jgi:hypothetical protein
MIDWIMDKDTESKLKELCRKIHKEDIINKEVLEDTSACEEEASYFIKNLKDTIGECIPLDQERKNNIAKSEIQKLESVKKYLNKSLTEYKRLKLTTKNTIKNQFTLKQGLPRWIDDPTDSNNITFTNLPELTPEKSIELLINELSSRTEELKKYETYYKMELFDALKSSWLVTFNQPIFKNRAALELTTNYNNFLKIMLKSDQSDPDHDGTIRKAISKWIEKLEEKNKKE